MVYAGAYICGEIVTIMAVGDLIFYPALAVVNGASADVRPPAGEEWIVVNVASSLLAGVGPDVTPDVRAFLVNTAGLLADLWTSWVGARSYDSIHWHITHDFWLRLTNTAVNPQDYLVVVVRVK